MGLTPLFDTAVDGNHITLSKPDLRSLKGAEALGVSPADTVVFEDAVSGVKAAKTGGSSQWVLAVQIISVKLTWSSPISRG